MKKGFTMLEILIGASIITASFLGVLTVFDRLTRASRQMVELSQAASLLEEGLEVGRLFRDQSWINLANWPAGTIYYLTWTGSTWATTTVNALIDSKFERQVSLTNVSRDDTSKNIVSSGGTVDPNTKLVTVTVAWSTTGGTTTRSLSAYLTNLFN